MKTDEKIIKTKLGLLNLAEQLGNVSQACKVMGFSRDSFYRYKELHEQYGEEGLREISRSKPNKKNRVADHVEEAVVEFAFENPAYGQVRVSNTLKQRGIFVSPGGVRSIWLRHGLEKFGKRLDALEKRVAAEGGVLTEAQLQAMERKRRSKRWWGRLRRSIQAIWERKTRTMWAQLRGLGAFISKHGSIRTAKWRLQSYTHRKQR